MVEKIRGFRVQREQPAPHGVAGGILRAEFPLLEPDARAIGQLFCGGGEIQIFVIPHERDDVSPRAAAETLEDLQARIDGKRGRPLLMKWAQRLEHPARAPQREIASDDIDDVIRGDNLIEGFRRDEGHVWHSNTRRRGRQFPSAQTGAGLAGKAASRPIFPTR